VLTPLLALNLRNAAALSEDGGFLAFVYCSVSLIFSLAAFAIFRIDGAIPRYFSVNDLVALGAAVVTAETATCAVLFSFTRLNGIPRSVPAIHALLLGAGLLGIRAGIHIIGRYRSHSPLSAQTRPEHVILIGLNDLSVLFMKFLQSAAGGERRVIGILDQQARWYGRSVNGVRVFGPPAHLEALIEEFATHGVTTDYVVVGAEAPEDFSGSTLQEIQRVCQERDSKVMFVPALFSLDPAKRKPGQTLARPKSASASVPSVASVSTAVPSVYFRSRRLIDFLTALVLIVATIPLWLLAATIAVFDVGTPVLFWQRRAGQGGRYFHLYKIRTLRPAFARDGRRIDDTERLSRAGSFLRKTRLDELPQLWNVLIGDMALIGPRPLLAQDQPPNPAARLAVRPGITGWAQVNGGNLLTPIEKDRLDSWYIASASLWLDLRIIALTILSVVRGDRRSEETLARVWSEAPASSRQTSLSTRFAAGRGEHSRGEAEQRPAARSL
jgi:lipopolysaccharide/colanic/teichoic acid biosynthesis glycosyltransferase